MLTGFRASRALRLALFLPFALAATMSPAGAAGALAYGKCGAYGQAFDFAVPERAREAALKRCKGDCTAVPIAKACAALSVDMANPCGSHGYAVAPTISTAQNGALKECYRQGGKDCIIRAWTCDGRG